MQKLADICIRRPVFATMLITALLVMGLAAYRGLGVDLFPKIEFPIVTVTTTLRGAAPEEVETQVTKRIEEAVNTVSGIDELRSVSAEGVSQVFVTFVLEKDADVGAQEVRDKVSSVLSELPRDVDPPVVEKLSTDASPVINIVVASGRDLRETTKIVDDRIKKNIESLAGVGQVRFVGDRTRQVQIWLDGDKLYAYNLNIEQVREAIAAQNVEIPGGRIDQGPRELTLRTLGRVERPRDFERIIVATLGSAPVRVSDIGTVEDGVEEPRSLALLDGKPAVVLEVRKQSGTNTLDVIRTVKERVEELARGLPPDFRVTYTRDQSTFIEASFHAVQEHLILGGFFAAIIVLFFIRDWRSTLIAAIAIPTSIISTYTLMSLMGFTLNQITMLALTLVVGIVIDDAIVVLENIFRFAEEKNLTPMQAALEGTKDISLAVLATTLSLVIIFIPVALMGGIVGRFMSSFGYTAAFAIMVSLLVSFTLTPMLCSRFLKTGSGHSGTKETWLFKVLDRPYKRFLRWSMTHRWAVALAAVAIMFSSGPLFMIVGKDFLPVDDQSEFEISVRMPVGSSLEGTESVMRELEREVHSLPGIQHLLTTIGADTQRRVDRGSILVELVPTDQREKSQMELMAMARERLKRFHDLVIGVQLPSIIQGGGPNQDLQFFLQGPDLEELNRYATIIKQRLAAVTGVVDLESSYEPGKPEVRVKINRDKAADLNVHVASIANALRVLVGGDDQVTTYREGDDRYDVQVRLSKEFRTSPGALERLYVPSSTLGNVLVSSVASLEESGGPTQIERYNRQRQILVTANIAEGQSLSQVLTVLNQTVAELNMPAEYTTGLTGRSREFGRASLNYIIAFLLSIVFMYMVLAAQFESFIDPVTILISLPLSVPFALVSLLLTGENFSIIYTSLGILILFGIVKKNSILQIDHIKALRQEGMPRLEAILKGCEDRLRPILMTTAALVAGMIPLALGTGAGSGSRRTVAIVVIGGQSLCLLLTLLVTPVTYSLFDDLVHSPVWARLGRLLTMSKRASAIASMLLVALALPATGQTTEPHRVGVGLLERRLSLKEAVELALENNLEIEIERTSRATAYQSIRAARGFFDPTFRWLPSLESRNTPAGSVLQGASGRLAERFHSQNFYFDQRLPWQGSGLRLEFENSRQSSTNPFVTLNPFITSRLMFSFTQPLLRNRLIDRGRADLQIRRKQAGVSEMQLRIKVIDVITRVEEVYWDLVAARQDAAVKEDAVKLAREQLARNKRMIEAGTLAPVELSASEAELERRLDTWYASVGAVTEKENLLKTLLAGDRQAPLWNEAVIPTDSSTVAPPEIYDLREAVESALRARPELAVLKDYQEVNRIEKRHSADQVKPQVNLVAAYGSSGLAGTLRAGDNPFTASNAALYERINQLSTKSGLTPLAPPSFGALPDLLIGGYGSTLSNLFGGRFQTFQVGLAFDLNLRNNTAEANLAQSVIAERRLKLQQTQLEQGIEAQVRNAMQAIQTARQRMTAAEAGARAAQEKLDSETRLFQTGESTNFLVLTRQNEYADSRSREVAARLDFNKAVARLQQAVGSTLETHGVTVK
ncbi:MAG: efflux RND transporter permease subunit [Bryobacterales bacterium]|nr:efflux RND transporter permease subunit [Bryobacterales bacterium]